MATAKTGTTTAKREAAKKRATAARARAHKMSGGHMSGFMNFIREQGVVGLAIGLAIGTVASGTVKALVDGFVNPIVQFIVGSQAGLEAATWHVAFWGRQADFKWGAALSSLITLIATALIVYLVIHAAKLDRMDKAKE